MNRVLVFLAALMLVLPNIASAATEITVKPTRTKGNAPQCYNTAEAEAEQGIRIHSELMVIGLNCNHMGLRNGQPLYQMYREFTARHSALLAKYEELLLAWFEKTGQPKPEAALNTLRTDFGNKISNDAARARPDIFCSKYAPRMLKAAKMSTEEVRKWAAMSYNTHPVSHPMCGDKK